MSGGGTHQGASSSLVSIRGCWPSFVFIFGCSSSSGVALVVVVARDVALPHHRWLFRCWLCAVVVGGRWRQWQQAVGDGGDGGGGGDRCRGWWCHGWWLKARSCC